MTVIESWCHVVMRYLDQVKLMPSLVACRQRIIFPNMMHPAARLRALSLSLSLSLSCIEAEVLGVGLESSWRVATRGSSLQARLQQGAPATRGARRQLRETCTSTSMCANELPKFDF